MSRKNRTPGDRLRVAIEALRIGVPEFSKEIEVHHSLVYRQLAKKEGPLSAKLVSRAEERFGINPNFLNYGQEPIFLPGTAIRMAEPDGRYTTAAWQVIAVISSQDDLEVFRDHNPTDPLVDFRAWVITRSSSEPDFPAWVRLELKNRFPDFKDWLESLKSKKDLEAPNED